MLKFSRSMLHIFRNFNLIIMVFSLLGCSPLTIIKSAKREQHQNVYNAFPNLMIKPTGEVYFSLLGLMKGDFVPSSFKINYQNKVIYIDPLIVDDSQTADFIFITHEHDDHFSIEDINKLSKEKTVILGPKSVIKKIKNQNTRIVRVGEKITIGNIMCEAVHSYNTDKGFFSPILHEKNDEFLGYIISFGDFRIYHMGDTDVIPEMENINNIDIALVPIGEGATAMTPEQAAVAVNQIQPKIAIPMHYKLGLNKTIELKKCVNNTTEVIILTKDE